MDGNLTAALYLLLVQGAMGAFDTLWYHEYRQQLPRNATARTELRLHAVRDFAYALVFGSLGWVEWRGSWALLFLGILALEIAITLWDFVEEDMTRRLPAGERVMHSVMGIVYGAFLACLVPVVVRWAALPTAFAPAAQGWLAWLLTAYGVGVLLSGVRDIYASFRMKPGTAAARAR